MPTTRAALLVAIAMAAGSIGSARAQESGAPAAPVPRPAPGAPSIVAIKFSGLLIDEHQSLDALAAIIAPPGSFFVESGDADTTGTPIGTLPRLRAALESIGYAALLSTEPAAGGIRITATLRPHDRVRHIFVEGNWPLRQDEIIRRLSLRPGQPIPDAGPARDTFLDAERSRVLTFLHSEGYLKARVDLRLTPRGAPPAPHDLTAHINLGPGFPLGRLTVRGGTAVPRSEINELFSHSDWRFLLLRPLPFRQAAVRDDVADLVLRYRELGYPAVRVLPHFNLREAAESPERNVPLDLHINEHKRVEVVFKGNNCCADSVLREQVTFLKSGAFDDFEVESSRRSLAHFLRERGNMFAEVTARREPISDKAERVTFTQIEGPRLRVRGIEFIGQTKFTAGTLGGVVTVQTFPFIGYLGLGGGGHASLQQLANDAERIIDHYARQGLVGAQVKVDIGPHPSTLRPIATTMSGRDRADWERAKALFVRFTVLSEGSRQSIEAITFRRDDGAALPHDDAFFGASIIMRRRQPYRPGWVRGDGERLIAVLRDDGYPNATAEPTVTERGGAVRIDWVLRPGPRVTVGPIFVRGNFHTTRATILQWIPLQPGSFLTSTGFDRGQRNLSLLQYFTNANPIRFPGQETGLTTVPMLVAVEERHDHYGKARVGVGGSTDQKDPGGTIPLGGFVSLGYDHGNLIGRGYHLRTRGDIGNSLTRAQGDFEDPRLYGTLFRLQLSALYLRQATVRLGDVRSGSAVVGVAREIFPGVDAFVRYGVRDIVRTEYLLRGAGADAAQRTVRLGTLVGSVSFGFDWLRLDNLLVPRQGFKVHGSIEYATPALSLGLGVDQFIKLHGRVLTVVPLSSRVGLRYSLRYDHGLPLAGASFLPRVERFFGGGDTTVRGYELDRVRTAVVTSALSPNTNLLQFLPLGGNLRVLSNLELQYQIAGAWYGAIFLDSGLVEDSLDALRPSRFRHGAGVSPLLIKLPIGDLSVSWAWPLNPGPGDSRAGRLHFNVGLMF